MAMSAARQRSHRCHNGDATVNNDYFLGLCVTDDEMVAPEPQQAAMRWRLCDAPSPQQGGCTTVWRSDTLCDSRGVYRNYTVTKGQQRCWIVTTPRPLATSNAYC